MGALVAASGEWDHTRKVSDSEDRGPFAGPPGPRPGDLPSPSSPHDPLRDLAARTAAGDRRATDHVLRALAPRILGVARRILGAGHPDVEDASQEALVAVVRALAGFRGESSVQHYATRIAVRTCLHVRKRAHLREHRRGLVEAEGGLRSPAPDAVVTARRRELLLEVMATVSPEQAETLVMRVVLGLSLQEVAEATGVPVNTVRSRVRLAKEALRRRLERSPGRGELEGGS